VGEVVDHLDAAGLAAEFLAAGDALEVRRPARISSWESPAKAAAAAAMAALRTLNSPVMGTE
jgi:hypothetical protein